MATLYYESSFAHHGIKGQKWYVRRFQNPDGTLTKAGMARTKDRISAYSHAHTIPAGTTIYRSTVNPNEGVSGMKYVTYLEPDRDHYRGAKADQIRETSGKTKNDPLYEHQMVAKEPIKVASRDDLVEAYEKVLDDPKVYKNALNYMCGSGAIRKDVGTIDADRGISDYVSRYGKKTEKDIIFPAMQVLGGMKPVQDGLIKELSKKGYNAMVDEASVGGEHWGPFYRGGLNPVIVFDGNKSLSDVSTTEISRKQQNRATTNYDQWHDRVNKNVYRNIAKDRGKW